MSVKEFDSNAPRFLEPPPVCDTIVVKDIDSPQDPILNILHKITREIAADQKDKERRKEIAQKVLFCEQEVCPKESFLLDDDVLDYILKAYQNPQENLIKNPSFFLSKLILHIQEKKTIDAKISSIAKVVWDKFKFFKDILKLNLQEKCAFHRATIDFFYLLMNMEKSVELAETYSKHCQEIAKLNDNWMFDKVTKAYFHYIMAQTYIRKNKIYHALSRLEQAIELDSNPKYLEQYRFLEKKQDEKKPNKKKSLRNDSISMVTLYEKVGKDYKGGKRKAFFIDLASSNSKAGDKKAKTQ